MVSTLISRNVKCFNDFRGLINLLGAYEKDIDGKILELKANGQTNKILIKGPIVGHELYAENFRATFRVLESANNRIERIDLNGTNYQIGINAYDIKKESYKFILSI